MWFCVTYLYHSLFVCGGRLHGQEENRYSGSAETRVSLGLSDCSLLSWNKSRSVLILKFTLLEREIVVLKEKKTTPKSTV